MTIAISCSVTVSIAADSSGMLSAMPRVSQVLVLACEGRMSLSAGLSRTSSNVRPVSISMGATLPSGGAIRGGPCKRGLRRGLGGAFTAAARVSWLDAKHFSYLLIARTRCDDDVRSVMVVAKHSY